MRKPARWLLPEPAHSEIAAIAGRFSVALPAARVLWHRGYRDEIAARPFLHPSLADLHDPLLMRDMGAATNRLVQAIRGGEKILLYGDYDVDGSTSVVILKKTIELAGGTVSYHVPDRFGEGYGMHPEAIEAAAADGVKLVVSVDTGIRAGETVRRAAELGVDVIITDHHLPEAQLPPAVAVVNPNRPDCTYPDKNLCGAGVAFKLVQALMNALEWPEARRQRVATSLLKMVSIATVADVVPLVGENRVIVKYGLDGLADVRNAGLRALLDVAGFTQGQRPTAGQVAFRIAPRINAAGRMTNAKDVIDLFLSDDPAYARTLAERLHSLNQERQETEAAIVRCILEECSHEPVTDDQPALVFSCDDWHRGVVGIVATRIVERFHRPVFVLSVDPETGMAQGSGRSIPDFHLLDALESMPELFTRFGGHRQAAGLSLPAERISEFRRRLSEYAASKLCPDDFRPICTIDARVDFAELNDDAVADVLGFEPFGCGNPAPVFVTEGAEVAAEPKPIKERHLRVPVRQGGRTFWLTAWNFAERAAELEPGAPIDVAFTMEPDDYGAARGWAPWRLVLRDVRKAAAGT